MTFRALSLISLLLVGTTALKAERIPEGFLGLALGIGWQSGDSKIDAVAGDDRRVALPLILQGASAKYDVETEFVLLTDITQVGNYYSGDTSFLNENEVYHFSFGEIELMYQLLRWRGIALLGGFRLGHRGYMAIPFEEKTFIIYGAPAGAVYWFMNRNLALKYRLNVPIALLRANLNSSIQLRATLELVLDPIGPVENPVSDSAFYSLGVQYDVAELETFIGQEVSVRHLRPFFKFTLLY